MHIPGVHGGGVGIVHRRPCEVCGTYFSRTSTEGPKAWATHRRCSRQCYYDSLRGGKHTEETKRKISETLTGDPRVRTAKPKGDKSPTFKGAEVEYQAVHHRLLIQRGQARRRQCVFCNGQAQVWGFRWDRAEYLLECKPKSYWTGIYSLNLDDYESMCASCHRRFDNTRERHDDGD